MLIKISELSKMPNININIEEDIHRKAKAKASLMGLTLKDFIIMAIQEKSNE